MDAEIDDKKVKSVAIILAAGASLRMGQSKQLLKIGNESLLRKTIRSVRDSGVDQTLVVLGSNEQGHRNEIIDLPIHVVSNSEWQKGMGSSLKCGVHFVTRIFPYWETILVAVCDQPLLTVDHLKKMINVHLSTKSAIVASMYAGAPGVPVLFHRSMYKTLVDMADQQGAKKIIKDQIESASLIAFPQGAIDLDTPHDLEKFFDSR